MSVQNLLKKFQAEAPKQEVIGFFGTESDRTYIRRLQEIVGGQQLKAVFTPQTFMAQLAIKAKMNGLTAIIVSCPLTLKTLVESLPDYRKSYMLNGKEKVPALDDYAGSFFKISGFKLGREEDLDVLVLNPLEHLVRVSSAPFIFKRYVSKITRAKDWFPHIPFTWELFPAGLGESKDGAAQKLYQRFSEAILISEDIETTRDSPLRTIECVSYCGLFADGSLHTIVIPVLGLNSRQEEWDNILWMRKFNALMIPKVFQNGMYDNLYFWRYNSPVTAWFFDTQHMFHSWYSELPKRLDFITAFTVRYSRFWKDDSKSGNRFEFYQYNAQDAWATMMSCLCLAMEMPEWALFNYTQHEFPMVFPCLHLAGDGLKVNKEKFNIAYTQTLDKVRASQAKFNAWMPAEGKAKEFNAGSPQQVQRLMRALGVQKVESSDEKSINIAAASSVFSELVLSEVLEYRGNAKLLSTYMDWGKFWNDRLLYSINPGGTDSLRSNSKESGFWCGFQIQNIPRGPEVKSFIEADPGYSLAECDYSQSEARCVGYFSGCVSLIDLVESSHDYHSWNAAKFFGVPYEAIYDESVGKTIDKAIRDLSKRTNHGANYNMGASVMYLTMGPKLVRRAQQLLKLPTSWTLVQVCQHLLDAYAKTYPEVKRDYQEWLKQQIALFKKLVTPLGWTRYFFGNPKANKQDLNSAVAHTPQSMNAEVLNKSAYAIWRESVYGTLRNRIRLKAFIHDSILFGYKTGDTEAALTVKSMMRQEIAVKDIKGVTRTLVIPVDISPSDPSEHKQFWNELK